MLANTTGAASLVVRAEIGMGAAGGPHCGFRRDILETSVLTLQIKFAYSLNSLKYQLSQSKLFGQALCIIAAKDDVHSCGCRPLGPVHSYITSLIL